MKLKRFAIFALLSFSSLVLAGEVRQLHQRLARSSQPTAPQPSPGSGTMPMPGLTPAGPKVDHGITEIGLERLRCLAGCPAYTLIVEEDGSFRYVGEYGVERLGEYTGRVNQGRLNQVLAFIAESGFETYQPSFLSSFLDGPTVYTMVRRGEAVKVVENYAGSGPATLWAIEQLIDSLLETAEWDEGGEH